MTPYYQDASVTLLHADVIAGLAALPDESVQCCVTSPPYWGLRDYGTATWEGGDADCVHRVRDERTVSGGNGKQYTNAGSNRVYSGDCACGAVRVDDQIGLEKTPDEYVAKMVAVFREVRRVLRNDGTLWLNLGDSYNAYNGGAGPSSSISRGAATTERPALETGYGLRFKGLKPKDLFGIPWRVAFALQADGWYLRSDIIWHKPNPMPESVTDRPTKAHEYLFLLSKSERYSYDAKAIAEPSIHAARLVEYDGTQKNSGAAMDPRMRTRIASDRMVAPDRNRRSVWTVATKPYAGAHFATFPPDLIIPCILAGCPEGGTVLDPFGGSGTTGAVAKGHGRKAVLIELNAEYCALAVQRWPQQVMDFGGVG